MGKYRKTELSSCVKGERFKYTFSSGNEVQNVALLTEEQFESYKKDINSVKRKPLSSPAIITSTTDDEKLVMVRDLGGKDYPADSKGSVNRYSPLIALSAIDNIPSILRMRVKNAKGTEADESMIQYWKDNKKQQATVDLNKKMCQCPSCGKMVKTTEMDGAHVVSANGGRKLYITPICRTCNRSKVYRIFEVSTFDLVDAPE